MDEPVTMGPLPAPNPSPPAASSGPLLDPEGKPEAGDKARAAAVARRRWIAGSRARARAAVNLARQQLRTSRGGRWSRRAGIATTAGFAALLILRRLAGDAPTGLLGPLVGAARFLPWMVAPPLALTVAQDRASVDRREGIDVLAAAHGISANALASARALAAMIEITLAMFLPLAFLTLLAAGLGTQVKFAEECLSRLLGTLAFSVVAGVSIGGVAAACGRFGKRRGRSLLVAVMGIPLVLSGLSGQSMASIPGALGAILGITLGPSRSQVTDAPRPSLGGEPSP